MINIFNSRKKAFSFSEKKLIFDQLPGSGDQNLTINTAQKSTTEKQETSVNSQNNSPELNATDKLQKQHQEMIAKGQHLKANTENHLSKLSLNLDQ